MKGGIFLLQGDKLVGLNETQYEVESLLQELLANYPDLLVGNQVDPQSPRRWLHVSREAGIPGEEGGAGRWSLDHLFLDQDGIPTLVEVKRSTDTRIRREVVGQMLDYAANSVAYWPVDRIRLEFERTCEQRQTDPEEVLSDFLAGGSELEVFWQTTQLNLQAGRIRMIFVADVIPLELQRIVEFLNGQMNPAQVLAIEVPQYRGAEGLAVFAPRVVGQTAAAQQSKNSVRSPSGTWDRESFLASVAERNSPEGLDVMKDVLNWADSRVLVRYGKGTKDGSATLETKSKVGMIRIGRLWTGGDMHVTFESFDRFETLIPVEQRAQIEARAKRLPVACSTIAKTGVIREYIDVLQSLLDAVTKEQIPESTPHR
jgi:hypothetical protein